MKKKLLSTIAFFGFVAFSNAQETKFGVKAGAELATVKVKTPFGTVSGSETGFFVGGFAEIGFTDKLNFQPELNFVAINNSNTVNLPLLFEYEVFNKIQAVGGPAANYNIDASTDNFNAAFDLGGVYNINDNMEAGLRYSYGFGDVSLSAVVIGFGYKF